MSYPVECAYCEKEFEATDCVEVNEYEDIETECPHCEKEQMVYYTLHMSWYSKKMEDENDPPK